jgi:hypothetical protein
MKITLISIFLLFFAVIANSSETICRTNKQGINYCKYEGEIDALYLNSDNTMMVYFTEPVDINLANSFGFKIKSSKGAALRIVDNNKTIGVMMYESLLQAKVHNRNVIIHMRDIEGSSLKIDRIWIK